MKSGFSILRKAFPLEMKTLPILRHGCNGSGKGGLISGNFHTLTARCGVAEGFGDSNNNATLWNNATEVHRRVHPVK